MFSVANKNTFRTFILYFGYNKPFSNNVTNISKILDYL